LSLMTPPSSRNMVSWDTLVIVPEWLAQPIVGTRGFSMATSVQIT
jgi:hypothetical protein